MSQIALIIYTSENGRDGWRVCLPADVPDWVKTPATIARLIDGEECMKADEGDAGSSWYRAVPANRDTERLLLAQQRRERRNVKRARLANHTIH